MAYLTHVVIDVDLDATPITGSITTDHGARRTFQGWLELSSLIEECRTGHIEGCPQVRPRAFQARPLAPREPRPGTDASPYRRDS